MWARRLELVLLAQTLCATFMYIGINNSQDVMVGFFSFYAIYSYTGRAVFMALVFTGISILENIIDLGLYGHEWFEAGHQYAFATLLMILNLFIKLYAMYGLSQIVQETGFTFPDFSLLPDHLFGGATAASSLVNGPKSQAAKPYIPSNLAGQKNENAPQKYSPSDESGIITLPSSLDIDESVVQSSYQN